MATELRIINAAQVRQLLPMNECVEVMHAAMLATSNGDVALPPRLIAPLIDRAGALALMPGSTTELETYGAKVLSIHPSNPGKGYPAIQGFVVLFDRDNGAPVALLDGAAVTEIRTAAASGLATRLLGRADARTCGIFGTGVQAVSHIDAMLAVRPVEEFRVWGRDPGKTSAFAGAQARRTGVPVSAANDPADAAACDLVCTVTGSPEPILKGDWVKPGAHVNLVGAHSLDTREADAELIVKSRLYVDLMESCHNEGGDFMIPLKEGLIDEAAILGEIGQVAAGSVPGRLDNQQITLYNSLGITAQDLFSAQYVLEKAIAADAGSMVAL